MNLASNAYCSSKEFFQPKESGRHAVSLGSILFMENGTIKINFEVKTDTKVSVFYVYKISEFMAEKNSFFCNLEAWNYNLLSAK